MINNTESKKLYKVQSGVTEYPIGFPFQCNSDGVPQLAVTIGTTYLQLNYNCKLSEDNGTLILIPTEEEAETLTGPEDYSWMDKWVDAPLVITRDIPFVQESDYQVGRISPEQIEKDFDLSVMRDQILLDKIGEYTTDVSEELESLHTDISDINAELATKATKTELDNYKLTANAAIDANATAIQKTREDYISADSEIHQILNSHTAELTTLRGNQASLGDQVAGIEGKIPESASDTNHLITKQQLLDEEMDIRDDLNEGLSELQTQITAQDTAIAGKQEKLIAGDNIVIGSDGKTISATGAGGGAGLSFIVYDALPETGESGIIYLVPKDGEAPDIYNEYVWITATQTFELIGSTQVDLSDYATKEELANIDVLPDQTDNAGKFLTTDGTTASWSDKPLVNKATGIGSLAVGGVPKQRSTTVFGMYAGYNAESFSTIVGYSAESRGNYGVAIGYSAGVGIGATKAIQLGSGINNDANTFKVANANGNFEMMDANGTIPADRMSATAGTTGQVLTKTDAGMEWQEASGTTITLKEYDE